MNTYDLELGGQTYRCRPTFRTIAAIESKLGRSITTIGIQTGHAQLPVTELITVLQQMVVSAGSPAPAADKVGDELIARGLSYFHTVVVSFCMGAFSGPKAEAEEPVPLATFDNQLIN